MLFLLDWKFGSSRSSVAQVESRHDSRYCQGQRKAELWHVQCQKVRSSFFLRCYDEFKVEYGDWLREFTRRKERQSVNVRLDASEASVVYRQWPSEYGRGYVYHLLAGRTDGGGGGRGGAGGRA